MKQYYLEFFKFNDWAFRKVLESVAQIPNMEEPVKLLSHLIMAADRWYYRVTKEADDSQLKWSGDVYPMDQIESRWNDCLSRWTRFIENTDEASFEKDIEFTRPKDGKKIRVKFGDIVLQINYHMIHHRAQILRIIREQGHTPPSTDYIGTVMHEA